MPDKKTVVVTGRYISRRNSYAAFTGKPSEPEIELDWDLGVGSLRFILVDDDIHIVGLCI